MSRNTLSGTKYSHLLCTCFKMSFYGRHIVDCSKKLIFRMKHFCVLALYVNTTKVKFLLFLVLEEHLTEISTPSEQIRKDKPRSNAMQ